VNSEGLDYWLTAYTDPSKIEDAILRTHGIAAADALNAFTARLTKLLGDWEA
jgi:hypothetical protein